MKKRVEKKHITFEWKVIAICGFHHSVKSSVRHKSMCEDVFPKYLSRLMLMDEIQDKLAAFSEEIFLKLIGLHFDTPSSQWYLRNFEISLLPDARALLRERAHVRHFKAT